MIKQNQAAPAFSSLNQKNEIVNLSDFSGKKNVILYFYPRDDTPGCTIEANQFTQFADQFSVLDTVILGVSKDSCKSHQSFIDKFSLQIDLLADVEGELCNAYGVWQEKTKNGKTKMGIVRSTFLIDKTGTIKHVEYGVTADGHAEAMLKNAKGLV